MKNENNNNQPAKQRTYKNNNKKNTEPKASTANNVKPEGSRNNQPNKKKTTPNKDNNGTTLRVKGKSFVSTYQEVKINKVFYKLTCPLCNQPIKDTLYAIGVGTEGEAAHFDCVIKYLATKEALKENEQIIYIGGGTFAVAVMQHNHSKKESGSHFTLVRKIDYETSVATLIKEWRDALAVTPSFVVAMGDTMVTKHQPSGKVLYAKPNVMLNVDGTTVTEDPSIKEEKN